MDLQAFFSEYKEHLLVVLAGMFGIVAALIKVKMKPSPAAKWLFASLLCLFLGGALLFLEYSRFHFDPDAELTLHNNGAMLALGGCLCVAAGGIWGLINFLRLFGGPPVGLQDSPSKKK